MKMAVHVILTLLVLHVVAALAFAGWLAATGRVDRDRLERVCAIFAQTIEQEAEQQAKAQAVAEQARAQAQRYARLTGEDGMGSAAERLAADEERNELLLRQLERTHRELKDLQRNLHLARQNMERQRTDLVQAKRVLEQRITEIEGRLNDEGFRKAVALYEQLPADRVKQMFSELISGGQSDQVVAYLEAMQPRRAAKVLAEFGDQPELAVAVELTERLRARGSDVVRDVEDSG
jgi:hypothetical protein